VLEGLLEGVAINQITVDEETQRYSRIALERMLQVV
jgi:quinolinate synthase